MAREYKKVRFADFISDVPTPLSLEDYRAKVAEVDEMLRNREIKMERANGLKDQLWTVVSDEVKQARHDRDVVEMRKAMIQLAVAYQQSITW